MFMEVGISESTSWRVCVPVTLPYGVASRPPERKSWLDFYTGKTSSGYCQVNVNLVILEAKLPYLTSRNQ